MKLITFTMYEADATVIIKCMKIAKARKKLEARHHLKKNELDNANLKSRVVNQIEQLEEYFKYLTK